MAGGQDKKSTPISKKLLFLAPHSIFKPLYYKEGGKVFDTKEYNDLSYAFHKNANYERGVD
jgi:hypothetical protein